MSLLDRYEILASPGSGNVGQIYRARDKHSPAERLCALKKLQPQTEVPEIRQLISERFEVEASVLEKLEGRSEQIPKLYQFLKEDGETYIVQEWIEGKTLMQKVNDEGPLPEQAVKEIVASLLTVFQIFHNKGIIHRDIKPRNIILRESDGKPVVIDFGSAKVIEGTITDPFGDSDSTSILTGTRGYIPSEQWEGHPVFASDLFALGHTAIFLLTGKEPRKANEPSTGAAGWHEHVQGLDPKFIEILNKAVQPDYYNRYATANEMLMAVNATLHPAAPDSPTVGAAPSQMRRWLISVGIIVFTLGPLGLVLFYYYATTKTDQSPNINVYNSNVINSNNVNLMSNVSRQTETPTPSPRGSVQTNAPLAPPHSQQSPSPTVTPTEAASNNKPESPKNKPAWPQIAGWASSLYPDGTLIERIEQVDDPPPCANVCRQTVKVVLKDSGSGNTSDLVIVTYRLVRGRWEGSARKAN